MKRIEYVCDICLNVVGQGNQAIKPFLPFEFACEPTALFRIKPPDEALRHICLECLNGLVLLSKGNPRPAAAPGPES